MAIQVRGKNINITPALRDYVEKRVGKIKRYFEEIDEITVILTVEKDRHIVEVTVPVNNILLRGEEATGDMYTSIDLVIEKLGRQIDKYKTKISKKLRHNGKAEPANGNIAALALDADKLVKTKRFNIKPMNVDEAIMQMNLIGHDFFVFSNSDTEDVNVLYRRKDGNYGLLEPEM